jgi:hypothetical protein
MPARERVGKTFLAYDASEPSSWAARMVRSDFKYKESLSHTCN